MWWFRKSARRQPAPSVACINGLPLPRDLLDLIAAGRWRCPADLSGVNRLFPDRGEFTLYSLDYMPFENSGWIHQRTPYFLGAPDPYHAPGDIDPRCSILIGDLGIGYDQPIALDYRHSLDEPRVLTLQWLPDDQASRWIGIAPDIGTFAAMVGL